MMECNWNSSSLPWLARDEPDFPLGAKDASYLPSATNIEFKHDIYDLPDWMESRDIVVHPNDAFSNIPRHPEQMEIDSSTQGFGGFLDKDEDYGLSINPDDMLVPLSELQPEKYASPNTIVPASSNPKVSVRVSRVKVPKKSIECSAVQNSTEMNALQPYSFTASQNPMKAEPIGDFQNCSTDELLNELVNLANQGPNHLASLIESLDSSLVQAGMDELLSQLQESDDANQEVQDPLSPASVPPFSPACVPSPVPSVGSLSPQSTADYSFHRLLSPVYQFNDATPKSENFTVVSSSASPQSTTDSFPQLVSPVYHCNDVNSEDVIVVSSPLPLSHIDSSPLTFSPYDEESSSIASADVEDNLSVSSPVGKDEEESASDYIKTEMHSYSRSPRKIRSKRKISSGSAYPESRKERKKEQNKQAALRYRQKKKQEDDEIMSKIHAEEKRQKQLQAKYTNLKQELACLKKIMREVLIAKGTVSPDAFKKK
ncbi:uncharacterized protein [Palaemon carinicauda]|uniref:uncharacterized protein n=1 Tax=Palaemon carinicauda TaxID=392227 RepID=UPI0035B64A83